jgi:hypothetical protein
MCQVPGETIVVVQEQNTHGANVGRFQEKLPTKPENQHGRNTQKWVLAYPRGIHDICALFTTRMALLPYTGPFGTAELRHLLRRTLFGCSVDDLNHFNGMSLTAVVQELLTFTNNTTPPIKAYSSAGPGGVYDPALIDPVVPFGSPWPNVTRQMGTPPNPIPKRNESLRNWWTGNLVHQEREHPRKAHLVLVQPHADPGEHRFHP